MKIIDHSAVERLLMLNLIILLLSLLGSIIFLLINFISLHEIIGDLVLVYMLIVLHLYVLKK